MASPKRGLGRGLDTLIPRKVPPAQAEVVEVNINEIVPNPYQPRHSIDPDALKELAESIREHGVIQPLIVRRTPVDTHGTEVVPGENSETSLQSSSAPYTLIAGERRWAAAKLAGRQTVPVIVKEATPQAMLELALVENLQRADLNPLEAAGAYRQLVEEFGLTQEQVAARVGKARVTVTQTIRLLRLPAQIQALLAAGEISEGHARALLPLESEAQQLQVAELIRQRGLNVRQTEELVRRLVADEPPEVSQKSEKAPETQAIEDAFRSALGTKVELSRSRKGGRLVIYFYSEEELQGLYDLIVGRQT